MRPYSAEFKASLIAKMLPPHNRPVPDLARETQIPRDTGYSWRTQALKAGSDRVTAPTPDARDSAEKFAIVVETAHLNAGEFSACCRRQGLYPQQIEAWRTAGVQANQCPGLWPGRARSAAVGSPAYQATGAGGGA